MSFTQRKSRELFDRGQRLIPGGVNSPVRSFASVGGEPVYIERGSRAAIFSVEGKKFIDFCGSWGALILGHGHPQVVDAIGKAAAAGASFGTNTALEVDFASLVLEQIPYADQLRLVNSGTEAAMTAIRLCRGATGRSKIVKFDGHYHGHSDSLLVKAGSGLLAGASTSSAGIAPETAAQVYVCPWNDDAAIEKIIQIHGREIAAIIVEPVAGNMGLVPPAAAFLPLLRKLCDQSGALLIFDEVIVGFRLGATTYGNLASVRPDLTCLGKIIGGGLPIGAVAGGSDLMEKLAPNGPVYQAGTLSGNPVALAAGLATLKQLIAKPPYSDLAAMGQKLQNAVNPWAEARGLAFHLAVQGGAFTPFFRRQPVRNLADAQSCDLAAFKRFFHRMLDKGVYLPPSAFETAFISAAHSDADLDYLVQTIKQAAAEAVNDER